MVTENLLKRPRRFASSQVRGSSDPRGVAKVSTRTKPTGNLVAAQLCRRCLSAQDLKMPGFAPLTFTSNALRVDFVDPRGSTSFSENWPTPADRSQRLGEWPRRFDPLEREERAAWIVSEIVGILEATRPLRLDWRDPRYAQGLIDLAQEPEGPPDLRAGAEVD